MDDIERNDGDDEEYDEQIEQMIIENGILLHSIAAPPLREEGILHIWGGRFNRRGQNCAGMQVVMYARRT